MEIRQYLRLMGRLYFEGAVSDFQPDLLKRFGSSPRRTGLVRDVPDHSPVLHHVGPGRFARIAAHGADAR